MIGVNLARHTSKVHPMLLRGGHVEHFNVAF